MYKLQNMKQQKHNYTVTNEDESVVYLETTNYADAINEVQRQKGKLFTDGKLTKDLS